VVVALALGFAVVVLVVVVALALVTRPVATFEVRGLEVLALVLGATAFSICWTILGLELPTRGGQHEWVGRERGVGIVWAGGIRGVGAENLPVLARVVAAILSVLLCFLGS
jgi:hypothetical protein